MNPGDGEEPLGPVTARHREITLTLLLEGSALEMAPLFPSSPDGTPPDLAAN